MPKTQTTVELEGFGSLITIKGTSNCLGDLMHFKDHGVYDPSLGRVDVPPQYVEAHNKALDDARIQGLDKNCQIGQGTYAYYHSTDKTVRTFIGAVLSDNVHVNGRSITFHRNNKTFRGRLSTESDAFNFKRIR